MIQLFMDTPRNNQTKQNQKTHSRNQTTRPTAIYGQLKRQRVPNTPYEWEPNDETLQRNQSTYQTRYENQCELYRRCPVPYEL